MEYLIELLQADGGGYGDPASLPADRLLRAVRELPSGADRADGFCWLTGWISKASVQSVLVEMLTWTDDAPGLAAMVDFLEMIEIPTGFARPAWEGLRSHFEDRSNHPWGRSHALRGAMLLAQGNPVLVRRLQASILDVSLDDDPQFLRHVAKVAGAILRRYPDADFRLLLEQLATLDEAADEAAMEIGLAELRDGLAAHTQEALWSALTSAQDWFERSLDKSERRPDAKLYGLCTNYLLNVRDDGLRAELKGRLPELETAAVEYTAFAQARHTSQSWLAVSSKERFHWLSMASKLAALAQSLAKEVWLNVALVIEEELLSIFYPGSEVFGLPSAPGLDASMQDATIRGLRERRYYLQALDGWLEVNAGHGKSDAVVELRETVKRTMEDAICRRPFDATTTSRLVEVLRDAGFSEAVAQMGVSELRMHSDANVLVADLWQKIIDQFSKQPDYSRFAEARMLVESLVGLLLKFLDARSNIGVSTDPAASYLFVRTGKLPMEHDLQLDFLTFLQTTGAPTFQAEARDRGGGRADIDVQFRGVKTIVEVKKDDNVPHNVALANRYAGQATGYLTTGVRFGFLLVLDLTDRKGHQQHITERISVERKTPAGSDTEYLIVVARVQALRKTPHDLK
ncbi:hypothetical protein J3U99_21800 [Brucella pituitosa]|uniref:hypothetical protein n=2 Tax=Brucella pituitosa TaxID=571256 RepID=UPI002004573C|nr:hypothetical protein [Brucella pituitosa]MCK4207396.1 hypothetical protein [Brucella pituitosa]